MNKATYTHLIKQKAQELGFMYCGVSNAEFLEEEAPRLERWLNQRMHGQMHYMENHFDKRLDPRLLVEGAKSVVSLLLNYFPEKGGNSRRRAPTEFRNTPTAPTTILSSKTS